MTIGVLLIHRPERPVGFAARPNVSCHGIRIDRHIFRGSIARDEQCQQSD
jgi:hypothetical protein